MEVALDRQQRASARAGVISADPVDEDMTAPITSPAGLRAGQQGAA